MMHGQQNVKIFVEVAVGKIRVQEEIVLLIQGTFYFNVCEWMGKNSNTVGNTVPHDLGRVLRIAWARHLIEWLGMAERIHMFNWPQAMYCLISSTTLTLVQTSRAADALLEGTCVLWSHSPMIQLKLFTLFHISVKKYVYFQTGQNCQLLVKR